ncbi:serine acetyltransferase 1, chloroplastic-like [Malania oleifera]|uniref:serine acetyltransferase 1, chloroplastic-like n=1 Tax=Malania oleifera TaxID=397392 RepID=UPI0025ADBF25|nr:serine acetyltransferase 1, chloroplastic-like [Malania oleifera]
MAACINDRTGQCQISNIFPCRSFKFIRPCFSNPVSGNQSCQSKPPCTSDADEDDHLWGKIQEEALFDSKQEPILSHYYCSSILVHNSLETALANHLALKLANSSLSSDSLVTVFSTAFDEDCKIRAAIREDLEAAKARDPACISYVQCLLNFKGFLALQAQRVSHRLWSQGRAALALVIQSRVSEVFAVDIHPGARIGQGVLLDHATGVVVGETTVIGDGVSILHSVTLGGTGKEVGDRHPKVGDGVFIGAGAKVLGNVVIGEGAKIGAGSVVLRAVPSEGTAVGNPARLVGEKERPRV